MIIFDEKKYAENLLLNGYKNIKYISYDNIVLVKYWKYLGVQENEIRKKLKDFMIEFQEIYSSDISDNNINIIFLNSIVSRVLINSISLSLIFTVIPVYK